MKSGIIILILLSAFIVIAAKYYMLRRDVRRIRDELKERLSEDTNLLVTTMSGDRYINDIASDLNGQLKILQDERHRLQQGNRELKEAITNISHDIRTPLTAMYGYLNLVEYENENQKIKRYLDIIQNRMKNIEQLMDDLFRYSVIINDSEVKLERVTVNKVLEECVLGFYAVLKEKGIEPELEFSEKLIVRNLNEAMLYRVFSNLVQNAIRYSDGDLKISLSEEGVIVFSNHASKLSRIQVERLFNRFYTVEEARNSTGLGLPIAKALIENMNGSMTAQYEEGKISITIVLPEKTDIDSIV